MRLLQTAFEAGLSLLARSARCSQHLATHNIFLSRPSQALCQLLCTLATAETRSFLHWVYPGPGPLTSLLCFVNISRDVELSCKHSLFLRLIITIKWLRSTRSAELAVVLRGLALLDAAPDALGAECLALLHVHAVVLEGGGVEPQGLDQVAASTQPTSLVTRLSGVR